MFRVFVREKEYTKDGKKLKYNEFYTPITINKLSYDLVIKLDTSNDKLLLLSCIDSAYLALQPGVNNPDYYFPKIVVNVNGKEVAISIKLDSASIYLLRVAS